jgi:hypothetical protein
MSAGEGLLSSMHNARDFSVNIEWTQFALIDTDPTTCALGARGWITQEFTLSRRIVHYLKEGMAWTCRTKAETESGSELWWEFKRDWSNIVEQLTSRDFMYERDRLFSLKGLATEMGRSRLGDRYCFGLWPGDLSRHLVWGPPSWGVLGRNLALQDVPSWSWASRSGPYFLTVMCEGGRDSIP